MKDKLQLMSIRMMNLLSSEEGQDLIEYALIAAVVALAAVVGMSGLANKINAAFTSIGNKLASYTS